MIDNEKDSSFLSSYLQRFLNMQMQTQNVYNEVYLMPKVKKKEVEVIRAIKASSSSYRGWDEKEEKREKSWVILHSFRETYWFLMMVAKLYGY